MRVRPATRDRLNKIAEQKSIATVDLLDMLAEREEEALLLAAMNEDFESLRGDEAAWADFKAETAVWDATAAEV